MKRKFLALLLVFVMVAGMLPMAALAEETPAADPVVRGYGFFWTDPGDNKALPGGGATGTDWMSETAYVIVGPHAKALWFRLTVNGGSDNKENAVWGCAADADGTNAHVYAFSFLNRTSQWELPPTGISVGSGPHATEYLKGGETVKLEVFQTASAIESSGASEADAALTNPFFTQEFTVPSKDSGGYVAEITADGLDAVPANLADGTNGTAGGMAEDYDVSIDDATKEITVTANNVKLHANSNGDKAYWVGIGLPTQKIGSGTGTASDTTKATVYSWNFGKKPQTPEYQIPGGSAERTQTVDGKDYTTMYWEPGYIEDGSKAWNDNAECKTGYISVKYGSGAVVDYTVKFNVTNEAEGPKFTIPASGTFATKSYSDLQTGNSAAITYDGTNYVFSGLTLKKITEPWTGFSSLEAEQTGYYLVFAVPKTAIFDGAEKTITSMKLPGHDAAGEAIENTFGADVFTDDDNTTCHIIMQVAPANATVSQVTGKTFNIKLTYGDQAEATYTFVCSGVTPEGAAADTFTVTFDLNGATGTAPEAQTIAKDGKATAPANPSWDGYSFGGWYKEAECTTAWDFETDTVTENTTLYAKWTQNSTPPSSGGGGSTTTTPPVSTDKDSGTTSTTVKPSVKDETASVTVNDSTANALVNKTVQDKTDNAVIEVKPTGNKEVSEVKAEIPAKAVANLAEKTDASLTVATPVANVTISNDALADVSKDAKTVAVTAAAKTDETSGETTYEVAVLKDGEPVNDIKGEMKVSLPVDEKTAEAGKGLVAVLVDENGNETVITKSVMTEDGQMVMSLGTGTATIKYVDKSREYDDEIPTWAADAVQFTSSRQLFLGVSEGDFGANETMNRAMLVTVLHRLEGEPAPTKEADFADVTSDSWYAASAAWSAEMGIVAGTENGFDGTKPITRQDLALMLYRYANVYGSGKGTSADFSGMGGAEDVADYAAEAMSWAVGSGIIVGDENNNLDPQSPTTRAQVSVMLMRFVELLAAK